MFAVGVRREKREGEGLDVDGDEKRSGGTLAPLPKRIGSRKHAVTRTTFKWRKKIHGPLHATATTLQ